MSNTSITLSYANEDDRAFGLAGMAISIAALDALDRISSITLDTDGPMVTFSNQYYFAVSPSVSPKAVWDNLLRNYQITSTMVLSNVMARSLVRAHSEVPEEVLAEIRSGIEEEGRNTCELEDDEIEAFYQRMLAYSRRIFANPRVHPAVERFARTISLRRSLTGREIAEEMEMLQLI